jgi:DNA sulfur modification protein DndE
LSEGTSALLNAVYVSSAEGERILKRLTKAAGFTTDNIMSRLAIARSLAETGQVTAAPDWEPDHRAGKQIKGFTLLGRQEVAASLLAMLAESRSEPMSAEALRQQVRLRWEDGLRRIDMDWRNGDMEAVLLDYADKALLSEVRAPERSAISPGRVISEAIVGQLKAKKLLEEILDRATDYEPPTILRPLTIVGGPGTGKSAIAAAVARAVQLPLVHLAGADCSTPDAVLTRLTWQLAIGGLAPRTGKDGRTDYPEAIIYVSDASLLSPDQIGWLGRLAPSRKYQRLEDREVRMQAGGLIFGTTAQMPGTEEVDLVPYSITEVAEIVGRAIGKWPLEMRKLLAVAGRLNPEVAVTRGRELLEIARDSSQGGRPSEGILIEVMGSRWGMDRLGLTEANYGALDDLAHGQPVCGADSAEMEFLARFGFTRDRGAGAALTERGKEVLAIWQQSKS